VRQAEFERRQGGRWQVFERWLAWAGVRRKRKPAKPATPSEGEVGEFDAVAVPEAFRHLCADLALARERQYSADLIERINALALRGHHVLYRAHARQRPPLLAFLTRGFPRLVRREIGPIGLAALLFFGPLLLLIAAIQAYPEFASVVLGPDELGKFQEMYRSSNQQLGMRASDTNTGMFAFYIWNNVRIGFQTFAGGLVFGLGSIAYLLMNGIYIGAVAVRAHRDRALGRRRAQARLGAGVAGSAEPARGAGRGRARVRAARARGRVPVLRRGAGRGVLVAAEPRGPDAQVRGRRAALGAGAGLLRIRGTRP
jgi:hypothetical protein